MKLTIIGIYLATVVYVAAGHGVGHHDQDQYGQPKYDFRYGVRDPKSGDVKDHWEQRNGDTVRGSYSLLEADGSTRIVDYYVDAHSGFRAVVKRIGPNYRSVATDNHNDPNRHRYYQIQEGYGPATSYINVNHYKIL